MSRRRLFFIIVVLVAAGVGIIITGIRWYRGSSDSNVTIRQWLQNPAAHADWRTPALTQCDDAPFVLPSEGFIGLLYRDDAAPYNALRQHTGVDIFGGAPAGTVPVYAAYDGYLSRLDDWTSTVIIRHDDPLQPGRTIWTYYTHMASTAGESYISDAFPAGTTNEPIEQGTRVGYQGNYSPNFPVAIHLHFSIVTSNPDGSFRNEAVLENTLDPSPYFGMDMTADTQSQRPVTCQSSS